MILQFHMYQQALVIQMALKVNENISNSEIIILASIIMKIKKAPQFPVELNLWRRLSESDRSSEFCRLVPYRLAKPPYKSK